ncbi:sulfonate transport system ATP-binding protein [Roseateles asaccharophilus]|uniref:Sulfonate transport system ATP-binding protein n=2 Tax=Roseateles asaccharophilus TaxID=582607 RepID=A0A4R6N7Z5_9BURK|nr:sulfonate transport system ATP-binding protein [Roseateles asaccharophilus]
MLMMKDIDMLAFGLHREAEPAAVPAAPAPQPSAGLAIEIASLDKSFGERPVLQGIDLKIRPGEFVAIVGRSGCGKSTLLRLLAGLEQGSAGTLALDGQAQTGARREDVRIMFQDSRLLPWKRVLDNIALGLDAEGAAERARAALAQVGLADRAQDWPAVLSGGQRQRVALARALVHRPRLLLLDEPLGALDALTRIEMHALIESLWREQGFTAVLVTHDVAEAVALADRVVLIEDGRIALDEPVPLPRPRQRADTRAAAIEARILQRVLRQPQPADGEAPDSRWPQEPLRLGALRFAV